MNKFFKFLGIGTAIGTIAYGIIKYKHDEQFKEKVDGVIEKAEEKASKVMDKTLDFAGKHPNLTAFTILTAVITPAIVVTYKGAKHRQNIMTDTLNDYLTTMRTEGLGCNFDDVLTNPSNYLVVSKEEWEQQGASNVAPVPATDTVKPTPCDPPERLFTGWDEKYRENWDEVNKFAEHLDLYTGEAFMIEDPKQFDVESDKPIISHLVDGEGCYPPECRDAKFI